MQSEIVQSPLNYTGGKYKLLTQILPLFPQNIKTFVDIFCGGCNVGINVASKKVIYNDYNKYLIDLFNVFKNVDEKTIFNEIFKIIKNYKLSDVNKNGYEYYNCDSSKGLATYNKDKFLKLRRDFNKRRSVKENSFDENIMFYVMIVYSFNNQIRFNASGEFNLPVGKRDFNDKMQLKLSSFIRHIKNQNCEFINEDFRKINIDKFSKDDFFYLDPPYLITCATYNENGGWSINDEKDLLDFLDNLDRRKIKFALSNVLESKNAKNEILKDWLADNKSKYRVINLDYNYANSNYHIKKRDAKCNEVLVVNY